MVVIRRTALARGELDAVLVREVFALHEQHRSVLAVFRILNSVSASQEGTGQRTDYRANDALVAARDPCSTAPIEAAEGA